MKTAAPSMWLYDPGEKPKRKHRWAEPHAGFSMQNGEKVGKCPAGMTNDEAEALLNTQSVPFFNPKARGPNPDRLYVVHDGVVYRAHPTQAGISFHAFPEAPERLAHLPRRWKDQILQLAHRLGCREAVREWMAQ